MTFFRNGCKWNHLRDHNMTEFQFCHVRKWQIPNQRFCKTSDLALTESYIRLSAKHVSYYPPFANRIICCLIYQRCKRLRSRKFEKGSQKADFSKCMHCIYIIPYMHCIYYPKKDYKLFFNILFYKNPRTQQRTFPTLKKILILFWRYNACFNNSQEKPKLQSTLQYD